MVIRDFGAVSSVLIVFAIMLLRGMELALGYTSTGMKKYCWNSQPDPLNVSHKQASSNGSRDRVKSRSDKPGALRDRLILRAFSFSILNSVHFNCSFCFS